MSVINDINKLNIKKMEIIQLKQKIEELNELKLLKKLETEKSELENKIKKFCDYDTLRIEDIDIEWIDNFCNFLKKDNTKNTIAARLRNIRAVINFARKRGLIKDYVFSLYSIKMEETQKRSLTVEHLRILHDAKLSSIRSKHRDIFFLIFYLMGINIKDLSELIFTKHI